MNKSFKVVFNKARGALMVVNEVTSSVQAKGTKTVIAAAVATLALGSTIAVGAENPTINEVTYDTIVKQELPTFKFNSAKGETTVIKTEASATKFASDMKKFLQTKKFDDLRDAITQANEVKKTGILFGYAGGHNIDDSSLKFALTIASDNVELANLLSHQFDNVADLNAAIV